MRKFAFRLTVLFGIVALIAVAKLTVAFNQAEKKAFSSRQNPWPTEFKASFIEGCHQQVKNQPYASRSIASVEIRTHAKKYCQCLASEIEKSHVIETAFNSIKESESEYIRRTGMQIDRFLFSKQGKLTIQSCRNLTQSSQ